MSRIAEFDQYRSEQRMQDIGAVRVDNAFGIACGARRVAHAGGSVFIERAPGEIAVGLADPFLVGDGILQRRFRHVRRIG